MRSTSTTTPAGIATANGALVGRAVGVGGGEGDASVRVAVGVGEGSGAGAVAGVHAAIASTSSNERARLLIEVTDARDYGARPRRGRDAGMDRAAADRVATHALIADFRQRDAVPRALRQLDQAGIAPESVSIVLGDPELARELGGRSYVKIGVLGGALLGVVFTIAVTVMGGSVMTVSPGYLIGAAGVIGGLGFIGLVVGRSLVTRSPDAALFAREVERGDALISVTCESDACDRARAALLAAGAADIHEEASAGPT